jgi:hypothetical protein
LDWGGQGSDLAVKDCVLVAKDRQRNEFDGQEKMLWQEESQEESQYFVLLRIFAERMWAEENGGVARRSSSPYHVLWPENASRVRRSCSAWQFVMAKKGGKLDG